MRSCSAQLASGLPDPALSEVARTACAPITCPATVVAEHLALPGQRGAETIEEAFAPMSLDHVGRRHVERTLAHTAGNVALAARLLGWATIRSTARGWALTSQPERLGPPYLRLP